jgi:hypothetical protein
MSPEQAALAHTAGITIVTLNLTFAARKGMDLVHTAERNPV